MSFRRDFKAGAKNAPAFILILYILFVSLDIYTTYLASPDLTKERNLIIRYFKLNWSQIIFSVSIISLVLTSLYIIATDYLHNFFRNNNSKDFHITITLFHNKKMILSFIIFNCFYAHLSCSIFLTINNYLSYIYLIEVKNIFSDIAIAYLTFGAKLRPFYFPIAYSIFVFISFIFTIHEIKNIRNKYRIISVNEMQRRNHL
jgi:hypothetical protein